MRKKLDIRNALPITKLLPSIVTMAALCVGMTSVRYAFDGRWEQSIALIIIAAFLDGIDGRLARYLGVASDFGAQIDSLADFFNFGVAPAMVVYLWSLNGINVGWGISLIFTICMAIRLARFNVLAMTKPSKEQDLFFLGVPAPLGGTLLILPIMLSFEFDFAIRPNPWVIGIYSLLVAFAMASRIKTFSIKRFSIAPEYVTLLLAAIGLLIAALIIKPWVTIAVIGVLYIFSIPVSAWWDYRLRHKI
jgi:CDP-diacylglycerol---serine O-phosphatidyltransferase